MGSVQPFRCLGKSVNKNSGTRGLAYLLVGVSGREEGAPCVWLAEAAITVNRTNHDEYYYLLAFQFGWTSTLIVSQQWTPNLITRTEYFHPSEIISFLISEFSAITLDVPHLLILYISIFLKQLYPFKFSLPFTFLCDSSLFACPSQATAASTHSLPVCSLCVDLASGASSWPLLVRALGRNALSWPSSLSVP